jgi:hypothetical protein
MTDDFERTIRFLDRVIMVCVTTIVIVGTIVFLGLLVIAVGVMFLHSLLVP